MDIQSDVHGLGSHDVASSALRQSKHAAKFSRENTEGAIEDARARLDLQRVSHRVASASHERDRVAEYLGCLALVTADSQDAFARFCAEHEKLRAGRSA